MFLQGERQSQRGSASTSHSKAFQEGGWVSVVVCRQEEDRGRGVLHHPGRDFLREGMHGDYTTGRGRREH